MLAAGLSARQIAKQMVCSPLLSLNWFEGLDLRVPLLAHQACAKFEFRHQTRTVSFDYVILTTQTILSVVCLRQQSYVGFDLSDITKDARAEAIRAMDPTASAIILKTIGAEVFTDEFRLSDNDGRIDAWRRRGDGHANCCVREADK